MVQQDHGNTARLADFPSPEYIPNSMGTGRDTAEKLGATRLEMIAQALKPFAEAADRIEEALGLQATDDRPVRSGSRLRLVDLRRARIALRLLKLEIHQRQRPQR